MKMWHVFLVLIIGYFIGAYFGGFGVSAIDKVKSAL